jgi:hypothetical protein
VAQFDDRFQFNDHALTLELTEKTHLTEFFEKSRELFPDTTLEVVSVMESEDHAVAEWRLTATQTGALLWLYELSFANFRFRGIIIRVEHRRIVEWSEYYDQSSSRRMSLAAHFTEWVAY